MSKNSIPAFGEPRDPGSPAHGPGKQARPFSAPFAWVQQDERMCGPRVLHDPQIPDGGHQQRLCPVKFQVRAMDDVLPGPHHELQKKLLQRAAAHWAQCTQHSGKVCRVAPVGAVHRSPAAAALTSAPPGPSSGPSNNSAQTGGDQPGIKCTQEMPGACALPRQEDFLAIPQTSHRRPKESKSKATKIPKRHWPDWNFFGSSEERACSSRPLAQDDAGFPVSTSLCACARRPIFHIPHHHPDTLTHSLVDVPALAALAASAGFPQSFRGVSTGLPSACIPVLPTGIAWPSVSISCTVGSQLKHSMGSNGPAPQPPAPAPFPMRQGASAGVPSQDHDGCHLGRNRCSSLRAKARCCGRPSPPTPGQITWLLFLTDLHA